MPSITQVRDLVKRHALLTQRLAEIDAATEKHAVAMGEYKLAMKTAEIAGVSQEGISAPEADLRQIRRHILLRRDHEAACHELFGLKNSAIKGGFDGKVMEELRESARAAVPVHVAAITGWDGVTVDTLKLAVFDYFTDCLLAGVAHHDAVASLGDRFTLGHLVGAPVAKPGRDVIVPVAQDEDGRLLLLCGWQVHEASYSDIEWDSVEAAAQANRMLDQARDDYLAPVVSEIMAKLDQHGGGCSWHGDEEVALACFRRDWHDRGSKLAIHLMNVLNSRTADGGTVEWGFGDPEAPYVDIAAVDHDVT
jgi:hypothetical protein